MTSATEENKGIGAAEVTAGAVTAATVAAVGRNAIRNHNFDNVLQSNEGLKNAVVRSTNYIKNAVSGFSGQVKTDSFADKLRMDNIREIATQSVDSTAKEIRNAANRLSSNLGGMQEGALHSINTDLPDAAEGLKAVINHTKSMNKTQQTGLILGSVGAAVLAMVVVNKLLNKDKPSPTTEPDGRGHQGTVTSPDLARNR
jgi:uncharacterized protein (DUF2342 family)